MKKTFKALHVILLSAIIALALCVMPVFASDLTPRVEDYTYTVRIYAGNQGSFDGGDVLEFTGLKAGDVVPFDFGSVTLKNADKYYVSGIRESGKDNYDPAHPQVSAVTVKGDADYVVAYGIKGSSVAYTINYISITGQTLLPSATLYGNVGDKPVIAFKYIENYYPNAYNLTKTLTDNAAENVFTFIYQSTQPGGNGNVNETPDGTAGVPGQAEGAAGVPGVTPGTPGEISGIPGGENGGAGNLPSNPDEVPETIDIDPGDAPLAPGADPTTEIGEADPGKPGHTGTGLSGAAITGIVAGGAVLLGGIIAVIVVLLKKKK